jgi:hypothetical protein
MLCIASVKQLWCVESLNTMSRCASVAWTCYVLLLHFFYKFWEFYGKSYAYAELIISRISVWKFILVKFCMGVLRHPRTSGLLHYCVMGSPLDMGQGPRGSCSARSEPQHAWDSFGSASCVLESPIGGGSFGLDIVSASSMEIEAEKVCV